MSRSYSQITSKANSKHTSQRRFCTLEHDLTSEDSGDFIDFESIEEVEAYFGKGNFIFDYDSNFSPYYQSEFISPRSPPHRHSANTNKTARRAPKTCHNPHDEYACLQDFVSNGHHRAYCVAKFIHIDCDIAGLLTGISTATSLDSDTYIFVIVIVNGLVGLFNICYDAESIDSVSPNLNDRSLECISEVPSNPSDIVEDIVELSSELKVLIDIVRLESCTHEEATDVLEFECHSQDALMQFNVSHLDYHQYFNSNGILDVCRANAFPGNYYNGSFSTLDFNCLVGLRNIQSTEDVLNRFAHAKDINERNEFNFNLNFWIDGVHRFSRFIYLMAFPFDGGGKCTESCRSPQN